MVDIKTFVSTIESGSGRSNHFSKADIKQTIEKIKSEIASGDYSNASLLSTLQQLQSDTILNAVDGLTTGRKDGFYQVDELVAAAKISTDSKTELTEKDLGILKRNSFVPGVPKSTSSTRAVPIATRSTTAPPVPISRSSLVHSFTQENNTPSEILEYIKKSSERKLLGKVLSEGNVSECSILNSFSFGNKKVCTPFFNPRTEKLHLIIYDKDLKKDSIITEITVNAGDGPFGGNIHLGLSQDAISNPDYYLKPSPSEKIILGTKGISGENRTLLTKQVFENYFNGKSFVDVLNGRVGNSAKIRKSFGVEGLAKEVELTEPTESGELRAKPTPISPELTTIDEVFIGKINENSDLTVVGETSWFLDEKGCDITKCKPTKSKLVKLTHPSGENFYLMVRLVENEHGMKTIEQFRIPEKKLIELKLASANSPITEVMNNIYDHVQFPTGHLEAYKGRADGKIQITDLNVEYMTCGSNKVSSASGGALRQNSTVTEIFGYKTKAERDRKLDEYNTRFGHLVDFEAIDFEEGKVEAESDYERRVFNKDRRFGIKRNGLNIGWVRTDDRRFIFMYPDGNKIVVPTEVSNNGTMNLGIRDFYTALKGLYDADPVGNSNPRIITTMKVTLPETGYGYGADNIVEERQVILEGKKIYVVCTRKGEYLGGSRAKRIYEFNINSDTGTKLEEFMGLERHENLEDILRNLNDLRNTDETKYKKLLTFFGHYAEFKTSKPTTSGLEHYDMWRRVYDLKESTKKLLK